MSVKEPVEGLGRNPERERAEGLWATITNQGCALAALSLAFLWLFASPTRAAESDCQLVFDAIPSEDAGPIIANLGDPFVDSRLMGSALNPGD